MLAQYPPMLAKGGTLKDKLVQKALDDPDGWNIIQTKEDGIRYVYVRPKKGPSYMHSRISSKKSADSKNVDKSAQLKFLIKELDQIFPRGTVLDGEVTIDKAHANSNDITPYTGCDPEKSWERQKADGYPLRYVIWDCMVANGNEIVQYSYDTRLKTFFIDLLGWEDDSESLGLDDIFDSPQPIKLGDYCRFAHTWIADDRKKTLKLYEHVIENGGEGLMLKRSDAPYFVGKRKDAWVKLKDENDFDVVFMGVKMAKEESVKKGAKAATKTKFAGMVGAIKYGMYVPLPKAHIARDNPAQAICIKVDGLDVVHALEEIGTTSGFDDATRRDITENWENYVGRVFAVTAQIVFEETGAPRHPRTGTKIRWRDDKPADQCIAAVGGN